MNKDLGTCSRAEYKELTELAKKERVLEYYKGYIRTKSTYPIWVAIDQERNKEMEQRELLERKIREMEQGCMEAGAMTAAQVLQGMVERRRIYAYQHNMVNQPITVNAIWQQAHATPITANKPSAEEIAKHHRSCNLRKGGGGCSC